MFKEIYIQRKICSLTHYSYNQGLKTAYRDINEYWDKDILYLYTDFYLAV